MEKLEIKKTKFGGETKVVSMRLKKETIDKLDVLSKATGKNRNQILQAMLEFSVEKISFDEE